MLSRRRTIRNPIVLVPLFQLLVQQWWRNDACVVDAFTLPPRTLVTQTRVPARTTRFPRQPDALVVPLSLSFHDDSSSATTTTTTTVVGPPLPINQNFPGLRRIHAHPDIYILDNFLDEAACHDMIQQASGQEGTMAQSPVAYAGWTDDFKDLFELAAKGPVAWTALLTAWFQVKEDAAASQVELVVRTLQNYGILLVLATAAIAAFTKSRADGLQQLRTSTSTTLDDLQASRGARTFVQRAAQLFAKDENNDNPNQAQSTATRAVAASYFEAPTIIRYEAGQQLAPHFDANRSAAVEDANRGGQTLATLLVYLNDVPQGGLTKFGRLGNGLTVQPTAGDALLFFPADASGRFDERTEHEGCPAVDEKWIARIWRHQDTVPTPFGLSPQELARL